MVDSIALSNEELIPGTDDIKQSVVVAKQEFDNCVTALLSRINGSCSYKSASSVPNIDRCSAPSDRAHSYACFTTSSVASLNRKKGQVKLRLPRLQSSLMRKRF